MVMTKQEVQALLGYIEFNLTSMVEKVQEKIGTQLDDMMIGTMYDEAYEVLNELERTLMDDIDTSTMKTSHRPKKI